MSRGPLGSLARLIQRGDDSSATDRQLLEAFAAGDRATAFGRLVDRHGPMVLGVCRRVLGNATDADDAFQATFLVLARQAAARGWRESVANYLYGVAFRTALRARVRAARRRHHEARTPPRSAAPPDDRVSVAELRGAVDEEVNRLPEKLRVPVVLCCLHDRTVEEAAAALGLPATTVKGRLQQGRDALRDRLARRGFTLGVGVVAALVPGAAATVPPDLATQTVHLATTGTAPAAVAALTDLEFAMLFWKKLKAAAVALVAMAATGAGVAVALAPPVPPIAPPTAPVAARAPVPKAVQAPEAPVKTSAPAEKDGLTVVVRPTKAAFAVGERPMFDVTFSNTSDKVFRIHNLEIATNAWVVNKADGSGAWTVGPFGDASRLREIDVRLDPDKGPLRVAFTYTTLVRSPFVWAGVQTAPPKPLEALPAGRYTAAVRLTLRAPNGENPTSYWSGELESKPVEFTVAEKAVAVPGPVVVTEDPNGGPATVKLKVGEAVEVRLASDRKLQGWEADPPPATLVPVDPTRRGRFSPERGPADESVGTYHFAYTATAEGTFPLEFRLLSPSGPTVTARDATKLIRKFAVTVEVAK
ncbi:sigma-70 family rna polymerase sigma factor : RNA polymerase sigma factor, sigma-70 family OS=Singulisphaera acidiphila (strain ATCC BAA-1392 / DSM 18658 / VKM B-2454 / MOB10) GN=Sinac_6419 PE=4 SV=1: Sigma70_r2: Sigma70_r4_2 [Gemmataceae bacterium]|nr:sigma-70 family rna polymerase sigma factor : RNA polymerase sigma factor, sigma-70 family OS=Singulisphaera acidiphila (strain ATCC BAA-1392 / DSM 18658 / VKM B-2454 / MOB10) GN=Sinac_6419 PE=4 SV=1: Sigma70_r2: Sigma70_r4_2 [Gemmataceae bacterium]VTT98968.1 sigma-70 family rna polymerase sigma factor : RNA polymerase sigma factor, sigma-70 family OS=Singulisphaera acidiphila (strain ATCC BAA-1392 / DSM 18658 / VKM B-2454 / MOB10) GN=Sinac_6419 PE=4 SV=1: Sigma70_r2: Sigma70_r4_2 [Gemmataceae 